MPYERFFGDGGKKYCEVCTEYMCMCELCTSTFYIPRKDYDDKRGKYCSQSCYRNYLKLNPPYLGKNHPRWRGGVKNDPSYGHAYKAAYRARKQKAEGSFSREEWESLKKRFGYMCLCCKKREPHILLTADHIMPLSKGGGNSIQNIQPLCHSCNSRKYINYINYKIGYAV